MRASFVALVLGTGLVAGGVPSCGGGDPAGPSGAGEVALVLDTPHTDDGALLVTVSGGRIDSVSSPAGLSVFAAAAATGATVVVTGAIADGPLLTLHLPDIRNASSYTAVVTQAAARQTYQLRDPEEYRLRQP